MKRYNDEHCRDCMQILGVKTNGKQMEKTQTFYDLPENTDCEVNVFISGWSPWGSPSVPTTDIGCPSFQVTGRSCVRCAASRSRRQGRARLTSAATETCGYTSAASVPSRIKTSAASLCTCEPTLAENRTSATTAEKVKKIKVLGCALWQAEWFIWVTLLSLSSLLLCCVQYQTQPPTPS